MCKIFFCFFSSNYLVLRCRQRFTYLISMKTLYVTFRFEFTNNCKTYLQTIDYTLYNTHIIIDISNIWVLCSYDISKWTIFTYCKKLCYTTFFNNHSKILLKQNYCNNNTTNTIWNTLRFLFTLQHIKIQVNMLWEELGCWWLFLFLFPLILYNAILAKNVFHAFSIQNIIILFCIFYTFLRYFYIF